MSDKQVIKYVPEVVNVSPRREANKYQVKKQAEVETLRLVKDILANPVVEIVLGYAAIEMLQKQGVIPGLAATIAEGGVLTTVAYQQLAPFMPQLIQSGGEIVSGLFKAIPSIAMAGA